MDFKLQCCRVLPPHTPPSTPAKRGASQGWAPKALFFLLLTLQPLPQVVLYKAKMEVGNWHICGIYDLTCLSSAGFRIVPHFSFLFLVGDRLACTDMPHVCNNGFSLSSSLACCFCFFFFGLGCSGLLPILASLALRTSHRLLKEQENSFHFPAKI